LTLKYFLTKIKPAPQEKMGSLYAYLVERTDVLLDDTFQPFQIRHVLGDSI
jgi:hypothetical protein